MKKGPSRYQMVVNKARDAGYDVSAFDGWEKMAQTCGCEVKSKAHARAFMEKKFGGVYKERKQPDRPPETKNTLNVTSADFLMSYEWRRLRMKALTKYGVRCMCCGASPQTGAVMNVDHIKPRRMFPQLALELDNLQVLCGECNHGKGNWDMTDWRPDAIAERAALDEMEASADARLKHLLGGDE